MPQALPLCKHSSCDQVPADLQATKPLAFLCGHTNSRTLQEPHDHPVNPQHEHPPCRTCSRSPQSPRRAVATPLCLLLFFFLEADLPLTLSLVSISSLLSQDSPDTERTSSVGTQEASKPHRDFTGMKNSSKYSSREEKVIQVQEMLQWNHCLKAFW